jgi:hypothetical protein
VNALALKFVQKIFYQLLFMHKIRQPQQTMPVEILSLAQVWNDILGLDHPDYIIQAPFINGKS